MASDNVVNSNRKRARLSAKQVAELLMDSDEETIGNDDYDSSELETEDDDVSHSTQSATDTTSGALLVTYLHFTCNLPVLTCPVQATVWRAVGTALSPAVWNIGLCMNS